jgi:hypothetical protein
MIGVEIKRALLPIKIYIYIFWGHLMLYHATCNHALWNLQKTGSSSYELATKSLDLPISEEGIGLATYEALLLHF